MQQSKHTLHWARDLVDPALREAVGRLPEPMAKAVGYQFGWADRHGRPVSGSAGKGLRQALVLLSAEAVGGRAESAVHAAAAVELVHNFSLVHDDIIDGDDTRRHRPTVWASFGVPVATLAGDAMLALAFDVLVSVTSDRTLAAGRALTWALLELVRGQSDDVEFEDRPQVGHDEYMRMVAGKTAALFGCACAVGAAMGGAPADTVGHLRRFGHHLGLAFQMVDDLLGIWGDPAVTGKPTRSDLRSRKKTFPVIMALDSDSGEGRAFAALYRRAEPLDEADLDAAATLIERVGVRERTQAEALRHVELALNCLHAVDPAPGPATELTALAHLVAAREH
ncbi:polyprenyl synthetase family protein [Lentzea xinjiangensis]|nr:polyprenyl synthetase family protein [Lentzea xinjiangensis]